MMMMMMMMTMMMMTMMRNTYLQRKNVANTVFFPSLQGRNLPTLASWWFHSFPRKRVKGYHHSGFGWKIQCLSEILVRVLPNLIVDHHFLPKFWHVLMGCALFWTNQKSRRSMEIPDFSTVTWSPLWWVAPGSFHQLKAALVTPVSASPLLSGCCEAKRFPKFWDNVFASPHGADSPDHPHLFATSLKLCWLKKTIFAGQSTFLLAKILLMVKSPYCMCFSLFNRRFWRLNPHLSWLHPHFWQSNPHESLKGQPEFCPETSSPSP